MPSEPLSPELVLVDPDLGARARATLPDRVVEPVPARRPTVSAAAPAVAPAPAPVHADGARPYPLWARITAALWLLVIGILIGGAAIPHAQDRPRVVPTSENPSAICRPADSQPTTPVPPATPIPPFGRTP